MEGEKNFFNIPEEKKMQSNCCHFPLAEGKGVRSPREGGTRRGEGGAVFPFFEVFILVKGGGELSPRKEEWGAGGHFFSIP